MTIERLHPGSRMSQAVKHGNTLYLAGQVAKDEFATIETQTAQVLEKMDALLAEAGTSKSKVLSVQVLLTNIADFAAMNSSMTSGSIQPIPRPAPATRPGWLRPIYGWKSSLSPRSTKAVKTKRPRKRFRGRFFMSSRPNARGSRTDRRFPFPRPARPSA